MDSLLICSIAYVPPCLIFGLLSIVSLRPTSIVTNYPCGGSPYVVGHKFENIDVDAYRGD